MDPESDKKWTYFYSRLLRLIWNPLEAARCDGVLMVDMFKMQEFMRKEEVFVEDLRFGDKFRGGVYWNHVAGICREEWEKDQVDENY